MTEPVPKFARPANVDDLKLLLRALNDHEVLERAFEAARKAR